MSNNKELSKLFPEYFGNQSDEIEIFAKCFVFLEEIANRYNVECNPTVTKKQVNEAIIIMAEIKEVCKKLNHH